MSERDGTTPSPGPDLSRERKTLLAMIRIYCRGNHDGGKPLCDECQDLYVYAMGRLDRCTFGETKPVCAKCPIHCYQPLMRERVREVMRYSGPKMLLRHPLLALGHLRDQAKSSPSLDKKFDNPRGNRQDGLHALRDEGGDPGSGFRAFDCCVRAFSWKEGCHVTQP